MLCPQITKSTNKTFQMAICGLLFEMFYLTLKSKKMKYKKLKTSTVFLLLALGGLFAQQAIPTAGGELLGSGGTIIYSVGQLVYTTNSGTDGTVAQGVQQPYEISTTLGVEVNNIKLDFSVFPNPTAKYLILKTGDLEYSTLAYQLFDTQGKLLEKSKLTHKTTTINMESMPSATYLLNITDKQKTVKIFKIIKN